MHEQIERLVDDYEHGRLSRRGLIGLLAGLAGLRRPPLPQAEPTFQASELNHVALSVTDVERSREFYQRHLGLETTSAGRSSSFLRCGRHFLALFRAATPGLAHYCYTIPDYEPARAVARLEAAGLRARRAFSRVYFDDPDGIEVQVSSGNR